MNELKQSIDEYITALKDWAGIVTKTTDKILKDSTDLKVRLWDLIEKAERKNICEYPKCKAHAKLIFPTEEKDFSYCPEHLEYIKLKNEQ